MNNTVKVRLTLEDGTVYSGRSFGAPVASAGECCFQYGNDRLSRKSDRPSYKGQILCLTYPLVGNYGAPAESEENDLLKLL